MGLRPTLSSTVSLLAVVGLTASVLLTPTAQAAPKRVSAPQAIPATPPREPSTTKTTRIAEPPSAPVTLAAFTVARKQLDNWGISAPGPRAAASSSVTAAAVQIRLDGKLIGRGSYVPPSAGGDAAELVAHKALLEAFAEADKRLPLDRDATRAEQARLLGSRVRLSLELSGPTTPLGEVSYQQLDNGLTLSPGLDGLLGVFGGKALCLLPSQMASSNLTPSEAARQLVSALTDDAKLAVEPLETIIRTKGLQLHKVPTTHLAQRITGGDPVFLTRGAQPIAQSEVDSRDKILAFAKSLVVHLGTRINPASESLGLRGAHLPWLGTDGPEAAGPTEQALAVFALRRIAETCRDEPLQRQAAALADRLAVALAVVAPQEADPAADLTTAATVLALVPELPSRSPELGRSCLARLTSQADWNTTPGITQAMACLAATSSTSGMAESDRAKLTAQHRLLVAVTPAEKLSAFLPFVVYTELRVAGPNSEIPATSLLRQMREQITANQLRAGEGVPLDLAGGVAFSGSAGIPSWSTARALTGTALMLRDPRLTTAAERGSELVRLIAGLRFLRQLQLDDASCWSAVAPAAAAGAIRAAPFDWRCPPDATTMTLLAVAESLAAIDSMQAATSK